MWKFSFSEDGENFQHLESLDYGISPDRAANFKEKDWEQAVVFMLSRLQQQFYRLYGTKTVEPD